MARTLGESETERNIAKEKSFIIYVKCWSQRSEDSFFSLKR